MEQMLGSLSALMFLASLGGLIVISWKRAIVASFSAAPLFLFPILALLSTIWSVAPSETLRAAIQYFLTFLFAVLAARLVGFRSILVALLVSNLVAVGLSYADLPRAISTGAAMQGIFGSKNQLAFAAAILLISSLSILFDRHRSVALRFTALFGLPLSIGAIILARSAGASTSLALALCAFLAACIMRSLSPLLRAAALILVLVATPLAISQKDAIDSFANTFRQEVLKKDATLTGRTYLWQKADEIANLRPWLGQGYQSFWRQGDPDAEGLWRYSHIRVRTGFNFHNEFKEIRVAMGWMGVALFVTLLASTTLCTAIHVYRGSAYAATLTALFVFMVARLNIEVTLIYPFNLTTTLFVIVCCTALSRPLPSSPTQSAGAARFKRANNGH